MAEIILKENTLIISETDLKGVITYSNEDFDLYSGYTKQELLGKPHSLIRHEDMPKAAFEDLWKTIKAGKTWNGFVKNKSKKGDFYWVYATVAPVVFEDNETRFLSIRRKPTRKEVEYYDALYKTMK